MRVLKKIMAAPVSTFTPEEDSDAPPSSKSQSSTKRGRRWFLTVFFPEPISEEYTRSKVEKTFSSIKAKVKSAVACYDEAPLTGRRHAHLGLVFNSPTSFATMKRIFDEKEHYELIKDSWKGVVEYIQGPPPKKVIVEYNVECPAGRSFNQRKSPTKQLFESAVRLKDPRAAAAAIELPGNEIAAIHYRTAIQYIKDSWKPSVDPIFRVGSSFVDVQGAESLISPVNYLRLDKVFLLSRSLLQVSWLVQWIIQRYSYLMI